MSLVAGIGCRRGATAEEVLGAIDAALAQLGHARAQLTRLATIPKKAGEGGIVDAAARLGLPLTIVSDAAAHPGPSQGPCSLATTGLGSVAESAALAAAGPGARLLAPRHTTPRATCALAEIAA